MRETNRSSRIKSMSSSVAAGDGSLLCDDAGDLMLVRFAKPAVALAAAIAVAGTAAFARTAALAPSASQHDASTRGMSSREAPVGIVSADPEEQAAILAKMKHVRSVEKDGYVYYVGTMDGQPVVDTAAGEMDETAELATWILDTTFHPRATVFTGTSGAQNAGINVGDVVLSGYVVDKSQIPRPPPHPPAHLPIPLHRRLPDRLQRDRAARHEAYFNVSPVTKVTYSASGGKTVTLTGASLARLAKEYTYGAARP
jgi:nucleoside phosphorylase